MDWNAWGGPLTRLVGLLLTLILPGKHNFGIWELL